MLGYLVTFSGCTCGQVSAPGRYNSPWTNLMLSDYRKKPVVIQAMQLTPDIAERHWRGEKPTLPKGCFLKEVRMKKDSDECEYFSVIVRTLEGTMVGEAGDWIVVGVENEVYPVKDSIFKKTYEKV